MANTYTDLLKLRMPALGDVGWDDEVNDNSMITEFVLGAILRSNVVISGLAVTDGGSLDVDVAAGSVVVGGAAYSVSADTLTLTSGVKNWVYVDDAGDLQHSTSQPTGDYAALALVDCGTSLIDRIADARNFAEGALTIGVDYTPDNYDPDTGQTGAINQHLAGVDERLGILAGFKNKLINGGFDFWQRGTSQTSAGYGSDDRWVNFHLGSTAATTSRQTFALGQTDVPGNPTYFSRSAVTTGNGAGDAAFKVQYVENVSTLSGQTATLSFWAKADSSKNIAIEFTQYFGSGGSPSSTVEAIGVATCALTSSWQKFNVTVSIPSISGKVLGTSGSDALRIYLWFDAGANYNSRTNSLGNQSGTFDIANVQLEAGAVPTPFESRPIGIEFALCQRYYQVYKLAGYIGLGPFRGAGGGTFLGGNPLEWFPMRDAPTVTLESSSAQATFFGHNGVGTVNGAAGGLYIDVQSNQSGCLREDISCSASAIYSGYLQSAQYFYLTSEL